MFTPCWSSKLVSDCLCSALTPFWNLKSAKVFKLVTATTAVSKSIVMIPVRIPTWSRASASSWNRKEGSHTSEKLSGWLCKTFYPGTYKDIVFNCALVGLQLSAIVGIYNMSLFIIFTMVWIWDIPQQISNSQESGTQGLQRLLYSDWRWHMFLQEEDLDEGFDLASPPSKCQMFSPWIPIKGMKSRADIR